MLDKDRGKSLKPFLPIIPPFRCLENKPDMVLRPNSFKSLIPSFSPLSTQLSSGQHGQSATLGPGFREGPRHPSHTHWSFSLVPLLPAPRLADSELLSDPLSRDCHEHPLLSQHSPLGPFPAVQPGRLGFGLNCCSRMDRKGKEAKPDTSPGLQKVLAGHGLKYSFWVFLDFRDLCLPRLCTGIRTN